jgi:outer membrane protein assembly factor BamB
LQVTNAREGFIATGVHIAGDDRFHRPVVIRLSADGEVKWARSVDARWSEEPSIAVEASDGDIVLATRLEDAMLVVRFSPSGDTRWSRTFDRSDVDRVEALVPAADGGVLAVTFALSRFAALTRIDAAGKIVWDRVLGTSDASFFLRNAVELPSGGFLAAGWQKHYDTGDRDGWLVRLSPRGDVLWQKTVGGDSHDRLYAIEQGKGNELVAVGETGRDRGARPLVHLVDWGQAFG